MGWMSVQAGCACGEGGKKERGYEPVVAISSIYMMIV